MLRSLVSRFVFTLACLAIFGATQARAAINIMPLGDSITQGGKSSIGSTYYASYRYALYFKLKTAGYDVNLAGSLAVTSPATPTPSATLYPNYATTFDRDHEGHWGKTTAFINLYLNEWLTGLPASDKPDVVVLNIGTNDANNIPTSTYVTQLTSVINKLRAANPAIKIVLSNLMVFINHEASCIEFNSAIAGLASSLSTSASPIVLADINTSLPANARYDGIHPNATGEEHMATVYFNALQTLLPPPAPLTADKLFGSDMVLQRGQPLNIWGRGFPGRSVQISLLNGATPLSSGVATVDSTGRWLATLPAVNTHGGPFTLTIASGTETLTFSNVLLGDVWLCSGQSNMDLTVKENNAGVAFTAVTPATDDLIRHFSVEHLHASTPQESLGDRTDETGNRWQTTAAPAVDGFTAAGFFFARSYRAANPGVPLGIIKAAWGSTLIESWLSADVHASRPDLAARAAVIAADPANAPDVLGTRQRQPAVCYNGMIHPLRRFALRGFLWYQGESNANASAVLTYPITQRLLIQSWREQWGGAARPWVTVQLPGFAHTGEPIYWPWLRDAQTTTLLEPNTALLRPIDLGSTSADLGDADRELHPRTKVELGRRLATLVRAKFDGATSLVAEGPAPLGVELASPGVLRVSFDLKGSASLTTTAAAPTGFEIAGSDGVYFPATAVLEAPAALRVNSASVPTPRYVRYAMKNLFTGNLFSAETPPLPVAPFRLEPAVLGPVVFGAGASSAPGQIPLSWDLPVGATRLELKRATQSGGPYTTLATPTTINHTDTTAASGSVYYYLITAKNDAGNASDSVELMASPGLILDNADSAGVTLSGSWGSSSATAGAYLSTYLQDGNTGTTAAKSVRYTPTLPLTARYRVYARWAAAPNRATRAPADLSFTAGQATFALNQTLDGGVWKLLGTFPFNAGATGNLLLRNTGADGFVIADAVQWVLAEPASSLAIGRLTQIAGDYTLGASASLTLNLGSVLSDRIQITGATSRVTLNGALALTVPVSTPAGTSFVLIENNGTAPITGTFAGNPAGQSFVSGGRYWAIDYTGGDGNDVVATLLSARLAWRLDQLGSLADSGDAADVADPDGDGESNFLEFATAQLPRAATLRPLTFTAAGPTWSVDYTRGKGAVADGLVFSVEWTTSLASPVWSTAGVTETVVSEDGTTQRVRAALPPTDSRSQRFARLRVAVP